MTRKSKRRASQVQNLNREHSSVVDDNSIVSDQGSNLSSVDVARETGENLLLGAMAMPQSDEPISNEQLLSQQQNIQTALGSAREELREGKRARLLQLNPSIDQSDVNTVDTEPPEPKPLPESLPSFQERVLFPFEKREIGVNPSGVVSTSSIPIRPPAPTHTAYSMPSPITPFPSSRFQFDPIHQSTEERMDALE